MADGWVQTRLGDLLEEPPKNGYSPSESADFTGTLLLGLGCLGPDGFSPVQIKNAPKNDPELARATLSNGDVLISRSNTREAVGFIGIFEEQGYPCVYPDLMMRLRISPVVNKQYVVRYLQSALGRRQIEAVACGTSGSMVKLNRSAVENLRVLLPEGQKQRLIAQILDTVDEAIRKTEQLIAKLKMVKQGLLHDLLTRGIDDNGGLRDPERHPEQFKDSPLGKIPREWGVSPVGDLLAPVNAALRSGPFGSSLLKSELSESGIPLLGIDNVHVEHFERTYTRFVRPSKAAELARYFVRPMDVMITIMGTVGRCCTVPDDIGDALSSKHVWTLTLDRDRYLPYLACLQLNYASWVLRHLRRDEQGGIMSAIRSETLRTVVLPVPPLTEARRIEEIFLALACRIKTETAQASKLRLLKTGLMEDLLTGRVRVTQLLESAP